MYKILDVADYVIDHGASSGIQITHLKLQKLLYYLKVWSIVSEQPLIEESFEKWKFGPVNEDVYQAYKSNGANPLHALSNSNPFKSDVDKALADFILDNYNPFDALTLSTFTHREIPWLLAAAGDTIDDDIVKKYYGAFLFAQNFPLEASSKSFIPVNTEHDASYIFDMEKAFANDVFIYKSFEDYKKKIDTAKNSALKYLEDKITSFA